MLNFSDQTVTDVASVNVAEPLTTGNIKLIRSKKAFSSFPTLAKR